MPSLCCAPQCVNRCRKANRKDVKFHFFPKNDQLKIKWIENISQAFETNFCPAKTATLCSRHFAKDDYGIPSYSNTKHLKKNAVPTIFKLIKASSKNVTNRRASKPRHKSCNRKTDVEPETKTKAETAGCSTSNSFFHQYAKSYTGPFDMFNVESHATNILKAFNTYRNITSFCDVKLHTANTEHLANRMVLAAASPFFNDFFQKDQFLDWKSLIITLPEFVTDKGLDPVLNFIYTGDLPVYANTVKEIFQVAWLFRMTVITQFCQSFCDEKGLQFDNLPLLFNPVIRQNKNPDCDLDIRCMSKEADNVLQEFQEGGVAPSTLLQDCSDFCSSYCSSSPSTLGKTVSTADEILDMAGSQSLQGLEVENMRGINDGKFKHGTIAAIGNLGVPPEVLNQVTKLLGGENCLPKKCLFLIKRNTAVSDFNRDQLQDKSLDYSSDQQSDSVNGIERDIFLPPAGVKSNHESSSLLSGHVKSINDVSHPPIAKDNTPRERKKKYHKLVCKKPEAAMVIFYPKDQQLLTYFSDSKAVLEVGASSDVSAEYVSVTSDNDEHDHPVLRVVKAIQKHRKAFKAIPDGKWHVKVCLLNGFYNGTVRTNSLVQNIVLDEFGFMYPVGYEVKSEELERYKDLPQPQFHPWNAVDSSAKDEKKLPSLKSSVDHMNLIASQDSSGDASALTVSQLDMHCQAVSGYELVEKLCATSNSETTAETKSITVCAGTDVCEQEMLTDACHLEDYICNELREETEKQCMLLESTLQGNRMELGIHLVASNKGNDSKSHSNTVAAKETDKLHCEFCTALFTTVYKKEGHMLKCHPDRLCKSGTTYSFTCEHCGFKLRTLHRLYIHLYQEHKWPLPLPVPRIYCGLCFVVHSCFTDAKLHYERMHCDQRYHMCAQCGFSFRTYAGLWKHVENVHSKKNFKVCEVCGKPQKNKSALRYHMYIHTGEKPFSCTECSYRSALRGNLKTHLQTQHNKTLENLAAPSAYPRIYTRVKKHPPRKKRKGN